MQLQAVIFDWAGTTIDFGSRAPVAAVMEIFRQNDVPISSEQARMPMGKAKRDHLQAVLEMDDVSERWQSTHGRQPTEDDVERLYEQFLPLQKQVLAQYAELIPGCVETVRHCRSLGIRVGSSTGYTRELMAELVPLAKEQGYEADAVVCADDVPCGRPAPWMCLENARQLDAYPMRAIVKVDDTVVGIRAGANAGMATVGVALSGNLVGLGLDEWNRLTMDERDTKLAEARQQLEASGADFVINTIADLPGVLDKLQGESSPATSRET